MIAALTAGSVVSMSSAATAEESLPDSGSSSTVPEVPVESPSPEATDETPLGEPEPETEPSPDASEAAPEASAPLEPASGPPGENPAAPLITSPVSGVVSVESTFTVSGTAELGHDQVISVFVTAPEFGDIGFCDTSFSATDTTWSCEVSVEYTGDLTLTASSYYDTGSEEPWSPDSNTVDMRIDEAVDVQFTNTEDFWDGFLTQTPTFEGTGPALGSVLVNALYFPASEEGGSATVEYCTAEVDLNGQWTCTGSPLDNGGAPYYDYAYFDLFGIDYFGVTIAPEGSDTVDGSFVLGPPQLTYTFRPAGFDITASGEDGVDISLRLYNPVVVPDDFGEGFEYSYGDELDRCSTGEGEFAPEFAAAATSLDCSFSDLAPGIWNIYYAQDFGGIGEGSVFTDDFILIPETPQLLLSTVNANRSVSFSGTGVPGDRVVVRQGNSTTSTCEALVSGGGTWTCTGTPPAGTAQYRAVQQSVGFDAEPNYQDSGFGASYDGFSALSSALSVTVPPAPTPASLPPGSRTPAAPLTPGTVEVTGLPASAPAGANLEIVGDTDCVLPIVCDVDVDIFSTPQRLGSTVTEPAGAFALVVTVPENLEPGEHTIVVTVTPRGGVASSVSQPITIAAPAAVDSAKQTVESIAPDKADAAATGDGGSGNGSGVDRADPATPSAISDSIPTLQRIFADPVTILVSGGLALLILLLVAFPAELLNSTLASNTRRIGRWYAAIENGVDRATEWFASVTRTRALAAALLVVLTSLIFGFVDPEYGFDPVSLRMTVSLAVGLFIVTYVSSWISGAIIRRVWSIETRVSLQPAALVFAVIGVVVARILEFSPGFLIGLVIGLDLVTRVGAPHRVRAVLTNIGVIVGLAVVSWVGFSIMTAVMTGEPTAVELLISDALVATTAEGLTAALAALLPLGFLDGHEVFRRSKLLWAGSFAFVGTFFALIVLPTAEGETNDVADVGFWILIMVIFAVVTLTLWALLHFTGDRESDDDELVDEPAVAAR